MSDWTVSFFYFLSRSRHSLTNERIYNVYYRHRVRALQEAQKVLAQQLKDQLEAVEEEEAGSEEWKEADEEAKRIEGALEAAKFWVVGFYDISE